MDTKQNLSIYNNAILSLINIIGSEIGLHFDDFLDILKNDYVFIFVAYILKISPESLKKRIQKNDTQIEVLSNQINPHNIELIIEYFKTINHEFDIPFDFQDSSKIITSIRTFIELFLDLHFLRMKKYQLIYIYLYPTDENVDFSRKNSKFNIHEDELHIYDIANGASILITKSPFKINDGLNFEKLSSILQNADIPIIICEEMFKDDDYFNMSYFNILVYQIKFILDKVNAIHFNEPKSSETDHSLNNEINTESEINNDDSFWNHQENCKFIIREKLISDLKEFSELNFANIEEQINQRFYWADYELQMIEKGYFSSLKKFYSKTIKDKIDDIGVAIYIYKNNMDILELQIQKDKMKIQNILDGFLHKIEQRKETIEQNLLDVSKQGLNYIMKETENIKEIEVIVDINKDLKTVIEQDF